MPRQLLLPESGARLRSLRRQANAGAEEYRTGPMTVVLYALTRPGGDPRDDLALAQGLAGSRQWPVHARHSDTTGDLDPALRPGWARALNDLGRQHAQAVVAVSRTAISNTTALYEQELARLRGHRAALYLVREETHL
ncbi:hypothetical protein ACWF94_00020 [Streptomyces sp. NPDC055078]